MPDNMKQGNSGKSGNTRERDSQGQFTSDKDNTGKTGRSSSSGSQGGSHSKQHMSEMGRKGGQS
jgi:hypothetical protein